MQFRLLTLIMVICLISVAFAAAQYWMRRPVTGKTLDGREFSLIGYDALLHCVMTNDAYSLRRLLLMNRYDLDAGASQGQWTLLQLALQHGCVETTTLLLENGADANVASDGTPSPLELARRSGNSDLMVVLNRFGAK